LPDWQPVGGDGDPARYQADTHQVVRDKRGLCQQSQFGWYRRITVPVPSIMKGQFFYFSASRRHRAEEKGEKYEQDSLPLIFI
jgi:hypothetical protein